MLLGLEDSRTISSFAPSYLISLRTDNYRDFFLIAIKFYRTHSLVGRLSLGFNCVAGIIFWVCGIKGGVNFLKIL